MARRRRRLRLGQKISRFGEDVAPFVERYAGWVLLFRLARSTGGAPERARRGRRTAAAITLLVVVVWGPRMAGWLWPP